MKINSFLFASICSFSSLTSYIGVNGATFTDSTVELDVLTIFKGVDTSGSVSLVWEDESAFNSTDVLSYTVSGDGSDPTTMISLDTVDTLPSTFDLTFVTNKGGTVKVEAEFFMNGESIGVASSTYQAFGEGATLVPLILILILGFTLQIVELALGLGIFIGACMISGSVKQGFIDTIETYILNAVADGGHVYVYMFTAFLGGFTALLQKSGGFEGFANWVSKFAKTSRTGQFTAFLSGGLIFFDDYANCLVVGGSLRPILDTLSVSREKLAFIVDATAAPIASLVPVSSWIGFEISLISDEIDKLTAIYGEDLYISTSAYSVFMRSVKFRYYSIFMLFFIPIMIFLKRDFGPMLVAERKAVVYKRKDGGDSWNNKYTTESDKERNKPDPSTPIRAWNFFVPIFFLIFLIFYILVQSGDDGSGEQSFRDKIEGSDSYVALLWGTMGASLLAILFYMVQFKKDGNFAKPELKSFLTFCGTTESEEEVPKPLITVKEGVESFIRGQVKMFPALIVLTLAWAAGNIMTDIGADRLFSRWILDSGLNAGALPTLTFLIAMLLAISTGTSWGTMGILFPLIIVPTYEASEDPRIFYATVSSILAGAIMGDHVSPISDTTILTTIACDCDLLDHVKTQFPYAGVVALWSILVGTVPIGFNKGYPNAIAIILGIIAMGLSAYVLGAPVISETGDFDYITELYMKVTNNAELQQIKEDTKTFYLKSESNVELIKEDVEVGVPVEVEKAE